MTWSVFRFEIQTSFSRLATYVYFAAFFALSMLWFVGAAGGIQGLDMTIDGSAANSAFALHYFASGMSMFGIPVVAAVFGHSIHQDFLHKTYPLVFTTSISKRQLLVGRFLAANIVLLFVFCSTPLACFVGSLLPSVDPDLIVANRLVAYLQPLLIVVAPNTLIFGAIFFAMAALTRNMMVVYVSVVLIFVVHASSVALFSDLNNEFLTGMLDPFGQFAFRDLTQLATVSEKNSQLVPVFSPLLLNRILWLGVGSALFCFTIHRFHFAHGEQRTRRRLEPKTKDLTVNASRPALAQERLSWPICRLPGLVYREFRETVMSFSFLVIVLAIVWVLINASRHLGDQLGTSIHPVTSNMLVLGQGAMDRFIFIVITIYSGQMVWREREANISQLYDAMPIPNWLPFTGKLIGLMLVQILLYSLIILCAVIIQASQQHYDFELSIYAKALLGIHTIRACLLCVLAMVIHVIVNHKYLGHFVLVLYYVASNYASQFGFDHHLYRFASHPGYTYSDMNGFGDFIRPILVFNLFWAVVAVLLATLGNLFWVRGLDATSFARIRLARERFTFMPRVIALAALLVACCLGGFIFYNTNVLNEFRSRSQSNDHRVAYEKKYKPFEVSAQPRIVAVKIHADIFPNDGELQLAGSYQLLNKTKIPIQTVLVCLPSSAELVRMSIGSLEQPSESDRPLGAYQFRLRQPMKPGDTLKLEFRVRYRQRGFTNRKADSLIVSNGTYFGFGHFPLIGYISKFELLNNKTRRQYGLTPKRRVASIDDLDARMNSFISWGSDWIDFEATVSTVDDQIAIAPGALKREWQKAGRRYFHYKADAPMLCFYSILSARYEVRRDKWRDVDVEIYYHKGHEFNLDAMSRAVKKSLEYCSTNFGPYQNKQLRIVEVPRIHPAAKSFPSTIPYSESAGFITKELRDKSKDLQYPFFVTAHEVAHQWWAHQVIGGNVQGASMLTESLAQYSALMVMKREFGAAKLQRVLRRELDQYLRGRANSKKEMPLALDEVHQWIHYHKGSLAMYALQDAIGEAAVNRALADFVKDKAFQEPPYTTSMELIERFRRVTPQHLQSVITDWFETITLYDNQARSATYHRRTDGKYEVRIHVTAKKLRGDRSVEEEEVAVNDWIDIGVTDVVGKFIYLKKHRITAKKSDFVVVVSKRPVTAGIDPRNILIDRKPGDNVVPVTQQP